MTTTKTPAATIRTELRAELGVTARQVSVCSDHGSLSLVIKAPGIKLKAVEEIANRQQRVRRCEITGDILQGGNTFVSVTFDWKLLEDAAQPIVQWVESIADDDESEGAISPVPGKSELGISRDRSLFRFWEGGRCSRISVGAHQAAEMIAERFVETAKTFDSQAAIG